MKVAFDTTSLVFTCYDTNQVFTEEDVKEMWEKYKVIYNPEGCFALRMLPSKGDRNPLFQIVAEDDGCISFKNDFKLVCKTCGENFFLNQGFGTKWVNTELLEIVFPRAMIPHEVIDLIKDKEE